MQQLLNRGALLAAVSEGLREAPVVALLGARQVGKTTLARQIAKAWPGTSKVFDLEVAAVREALFQTPESVMRQSIGSAASKVATLDVQLGGEGGPVCDASIRHLHRWIADDVEPPPDFDQEEPRVVE